MTFKYILTFFCLSLTEITFCQLPSTAGTHVDSTIDPYIQIDSTLRNKIEIELQNWQAGNALVKVQSLTNLEIFINDKETFTTYGKSKVPLTILPGAFVNEKDSIISIIGYLGSKEQKAGFEIYIKNEECRCFLCEKNIWKRGF